MVQDLVHNLCESLVENIGGVADTGKRTPPTPIIYLTQWRMMGNSTVHTDEYLTQWKVSGNSQVQQYLTQWKVEGNSVVDNNAILSCGDLGQDGKYHVEISNGVDVFDIALTEPLRKVGDVADNIELINGVVTLTRNIASVKWNDCNVIYQPEREYKRFLTSSITSIINKPTDFFERVQICLSSDFIQNNAPLQSSVETNPTDLCMAVYNDGTIYVRDTSTTNVEDFYEKYGTHEFLYKLATPTTETIQSPQIAVSSTNTYSSANTTPYSAFTYANPLIYSCGDYSDVDGKYHVKISNGATIYDIPLTEPLRKVNDIADNIEFDGGVATLTRNFAKALLSDVNWNRSGSSDYRYQTFEFTKLAKPIKPSASDTKPANVICSIYNTISAIAAYSKQSTGIAVESTQGYVYLYDTNYNQEDDFNAFKAHIQDAELIYQINPTTEVIQVSPFPISSTDTYTSANDTPYSAFEYKKNVEIWSCGEYSEVDGKYHILVQPLGGSVVDIALDEPLRKVNDIADNIEFDGGVAILTRNFASCNLGDFTWIRKTANTTSLYRYSTLPNVDLLPNCIIRGDFGIALCPKYNIIIPSSTYTRNEGIGYYNSNNLTNGQIFIYDSNANTLSADDFKDYIQNVELIYQITPTTEVIQVPQIQEAESYSCVISQGAKAVEWSSFETN